jgi:invasion protein IalB
MVNIGQITKGPIRMYATKTAQLFATTLCLMVSTAAFAQTTATETTTPQATAPAATTETTATAEAPKTTEADGLSMGKTEGAPDGVGTTYTAATFGDWEQRCVKTEDGSDPCQLYQLLKDGQGNAVAEISLFGLPSGQKAAAGATIIAPLETMLTEDLSMAIDNSKARKYPFSWCSNIGCIARVGFTQAEVEGFKKGNEAVLTIVPVVAPDQKVDLKVSLSGFTAGYDAVNKSNGN